MVECGVECFVDVGKTAGNKAVEAARKAGVYQTRERSLAVSRRSLWINFTNNNSYKKIYNVRLLTVHVRSDPAC